MISQHSPLYKLVVLHKRDTALAKKLYHWDQKLDNADYLMETVGPYLVDCETKMFYDIVLKLKYEDLNPELHISHRQTYMETFDAKGEMVTSMTFYDKKILETNLFLQKIFQ